MAKLIQPLDEAEIKKVGVARVRDEYKKLAEVMNRILDGKIYQCHSCNEFHSTEAFYNDRRFATGLYPECKKALLMQATDYDKKTGEYKDNREKTIEVFRKLDLPFLDSLYKSALQNVASDVGERNRQTAYQHMLVMVKTLPQYKNMKFANSEFDEAFEPSEDEVKVVQKTVKRGKKIFGEGRSNEDYMYLTDQYDDFCLRTQVDTISQEMYVKQICLQLLDIEKDRKENKDVSKKIDSLDKLMNSANLQPRQNVSSAASDSLTFGQLIEKWEVNEPIPEPDEDFKDVNSIGKLLRVYFSGHLAKALGLKNAYSEEYEEEIKKYTVTKPESREEGNSTEIYEHLFGTDKGD